MTKTPKGMVLTLLSQRSLPIKKTTKAFVTKKRGWAGKAGRRTKLRRPEAKQENRQETRQTYKRNRSKKHRHPPARIGKVFAVFFFVIKDYKEIPTPPFIDSPTCIW